MEELTMDPVPKLDKLAAALAKAQAEFKPAPKTGSNPHLKSEYATLDDIIGAIRKPLAGHGLSFVQLLGNNGVMTLRTILLHESGQTLESTVTIEAAEGHRGVNSLQALGSAITYMKRYALSAMLGIATGGDTDGEGAGEGKKQAQKPAAKQEQATRAQQEQAPSWDRPLAPDVLQAGLRSKASWLKIGDDYKRLREAEPITEKQIGFVASRIEGLFTNLEGGIRTKARYDVVSYLYTVSSANDLTKAEASALIDWTEDTEAATQEAAQILAYLAVEAGQQKMELD